MVRAHTPAPQLVDRADLDDLFRVLQDRGYTTVGPTRRDGAIVYDEIGDSSDLPAGWTDEQEAGTYRLVRRDDEALFGYVVGPHAWKKFLFPPRTDLFTMERHNGSLRFAAPDVPSSPYAFMGVRACELAAIQIQDTVFLESGAVDRTYEARRRHALIVAVNCGVAGGTCFCVSMGTGPACTNGFDLALTEIIEDGRHVFLVEAGTDRGAEIVEALPGRPADREDVDRATAIVGRTAENMGRTLDTRGIKELLAENLGHQHWQQVGDRCLSCANCTLACPTCFCSTMEDSTGLDPSSAVRTRRWDSCFSLDFSSLHNHPLRSSTSSRYRQWLTHKLGSWIDQFGSSGCVGCGRCITWCPVGIDLTAEVAAIRSSPITQTPTNEKRVTT